MKMSLAHENIADKIKEKMEMTQHDLGRILKEARRKLNTTQEKVAYEIGISREHYVRMEGNKVNITKENITKLENLFHMKMNPETFDNYEKKIDSLSKKALKKLEKCPSHKTVILLKIFNMIIDLVVSK